VLEVINLQVTALPPKDGSFRVCSPTLILLQPKVLEAQAQNVNRRILIPIEHETSIGTVMHPNAQVDMRPKNWSSGNVRNPALLPELRARLP
jgi:hypothetical protein